MRKWGVPGTLRRRVVELRIDPSFLPAFERLRKAFRKKSTMIRETLARAARNGHGLPQQDKLTLAWKQHKRAVFWVRVDRAIRLMYEQDGDVQTLLYVGKHQEAETFLKNLPKRSSPDQILPVSDWLQRTADMEASDRLKNGEVERQPVAPPSAQRQIIEGLERLFEDCLLNMGPAVVEEFAAPHVIELEKRLALLREQFSEAMKTERDQREQLGACAEDSAQRIARLEKAAHHLRDRATAVIDQVESLRTNLADTTAELRRENHVLIDELRRSWHEDLTTLRENRHMDIEERAELLRTTEHRLATLRHTVAETRRDLLAKLDAAIVENRRQLESETEHRRREQDERQRHLEKLLANAQAQMAEQQAILVHQTQACEALAQRLALVESQIAAANARRGWLTKLVSGRLMRSSE